MEIISIIPARGGSKGIPMKNLKLINGKPLLYYSINSSLNSKYISRTIVSSDHEKILKIAKKLGAEIISRPKKFSTDNATTESVISHSIEFLEKKEKYHPDIIVLLQNTSPLRNSKHIDEAIKLFLKKKYDSLLSCYPSHMFLWKKQNGTGAPLNYDPKYRPMRQRFNNQFIENGAIYITKFSSFKKSKCRVSGKIGLYEMPKELSIDIDTRDDLKKINKMKKFFTN